MPQPPTNEIPKRWPLVVDPSNRDASTSKDARLVNGYVEKDSEGGYKVCKRAGFATNATYTVAPGAGQGIFNWNGDIYAVVAGTLYKNGVSLGSVSNTGSAYFFSSILGATPKLILGNGTVAYHYDSGGGLAAMIGTQPPANFLNGWAYIDGTTYYLLANANIFGSGINDVSTWDTLNLIAAHIEPDNGVAFAKHLVYAIAFKTWTSEVFYDAGNATGSPLGPVQGARLNWGCASADSVQDVDGNLFWIAATRNGAPEIVMMENLRAQVISTPHVEKLLLGATFSTVYSWSFKGGGHKFYVFTVVDINLTMAYDIKEGIWSQWTDVNGNYMPICSSTFLGTSCLVQHTTNGKLYTMSTAYNTDDGAIITWELYTHNFDASVDRIKTLNMLRINADQTPGSVLQIRCNDSDYAVNKWTNFRTLDLGRQRPFLTNCGSFYRRAYHFRHQCATDLRISSADLQLDIGTS